MLRVMESVTNHLSVSDHISDAQAASAGRTPRNGVNEDETVVRSQICHAAAAVSVVALQQPHCKQCTENITFAVGYNLQTR